MTFVLTYCPICGMPASALARVEGTNWLEGRGWKMCAYCWNTVVLLTQLSHREREREPAGAPARLMEGEVALCALLKIDPATVPLTDDPP